MHANALLGLLALAATVVAAPSPKNAGSPASIQHMKSKIKNVVLIVMENRSLDNLLGGQRIRGLDNPVNNGPFCNPVNLTDPSAGVACSEAKDYDSITFDPDHSIPGNNIEFYGTFTPDNKLIANGQLEPSMNGFVHEQVRRHPTKDHMLLANQVMNYYTEEQVPVLTALTQNFVVFNRWFSSVPGPTNGNRAFILSGTAYGHGSNDAGFSAHALPQRSIFQQLTETNHTWMDYSVKNNPGDTKYFTWTAENDISSHLAPIEQFYYDAGNGTLPEFSYLQPSCCGVGTNSMHPAGLVSDGEILLKNVYDAIRASPQWNETLFIVTFDESGGFHDHVPPPLAARPDNVTYTTTTPDGGVYTFEYDRQGGRIPTFLISPWVNKAHVEQLGVNSNGDTREYSATSILRTLGYLWDFEPFTPRVEESPSFDHLILGEVRNNAPDALPTPVAFKAK